MSFSNRTCVLKTCSCVTFKLSFQGDIASKVQPAQLTICIGDIRDTTGNSADVTSSLEARLTPGSAKCQPAHRTCLQVKPSNLMGGAQPWKTLGSICLKLHL